MKELVLPGIAISFTSLLTRSFCGDLTSTPTVAFQPPSWVFGVVWPILYVTMGISWFQNKKQSHMYASVLALCCLWLVTYSCLKARRTSVFVLVSAAILSWHLLRNGSGYDLPLALWLSFASYLGIAGLFASKK